MKIQLEIALGIKEKNYIKTVIRQNCFKISHRFAAGDPPYLRKAVANCETLRDTVVSFFKQDNICCSPLNATVL
jgi:hypothetical protein